MSSTRLSPEPETIPFQKDANALSVRFGVLCDCPEFNVLRVQHFSSETFTVVLGSAWFRIPSPVKVFQMVSDLRLWPPAALDPLQLQAL